MCPCTSWLSGGCVPLYQLAIWSVCALVLAGYLEGVCALVPAGYLEGVCALIAGGCVYPCISLLSGGCVCPYCWRVCVPLYGSSKVIVQTY